MKWFPGKNIINVNIGIKESNFVFERIERKKMFDKLMNNLYVWWCVLRDNTARNAQNKIGIIFTLCDFVNPISEILFNNQWSTIFIIDFV